MGQGGLRKDKKPEAMDTKSAYNWAVTNESEFVERRKLDKETMDKSPERDTLQAKSAFLLSVYTKLLSSAVHLDKLHSRIEYHKRKTEKSPETLREMEADFKRGLGEWEKAKAAAEWLARDYGVSIRAVQLGVAELRREETNDKEVGKRKKEMAALDKETKDLKTEALSVGFHYLDSDGSGFLEPTDVPNIPTEIFARLDASGKHRVSWSEVKQAIATMENNIKGYNHEITQLRELNNNLDSKILAEHSVRLRELQEKKLKEEKNLHEVCDLFRTAFTKNVFDSLPQEGPLASLTKAVQPTAAAYMMEEIQAPREILESTPQQPWMLNIGSDIIRRHVPLPTHEEVKRETEEATAPIPATATSAQEQPLKGKEGLDTQVEKLHKSDKDKVAIQEPSEQAMVSSITTTSSTTTTPKEQDSPKLSTRTLHRTEHTTTKPSTTAAAAAANEPPATIDEQLSKGVSGLKMDEQPEYFGKNQPMSTKPGNVSSETAVVNPQQPEKLVVEQDDNDNTTTTTKSENEPEDAVKEKPVGWRKKLAEFINPTDKEESS